MITMANAPDNQQDQQDAVQRESLYETIRKWFKNFFKPKPQVIQVSAAEEAKLNAVQGIGADIDRLDDEADTLNQRVENSLNGIKPTEPPKENAREGEWMAFQEDQLAQQQQVHNVQRIYEQEMKQIQRDRDGLTIEMEKEGVTAEFADQLPALDAKIGLDGEGPKTRDIIAIGAAIESNLLQAEQSMQSLSAPASDLANDQSAPAQSSPEVIESKGKPFEQTIMLNDPNDLSILPYYFADLQDDNTDKSYADYKQNPPFFIVEKEPGEFTQAEESLAIQGNLHQQTAIHIDSPEKLALLEKYVDHAIKNDAQLTASDFNERYEAHELQRAGEDYFRDDYLPASSGPSGP
jgi:hypothetical protein